MATNSAQIIIPPVLNDLRRTSIVAFLTKYDTYVSKIANVNNQVTKRNAQHVTSLKLCIDSDTLYNAILLGLIEGVSDTEHLTDQNLRKFLDSRIRNGQDSQDVASRFDATLRRVTFKPSASDPIGTVDAFFIALIKSAKLEGITDLLNCPNRAVARKIIEKLTPEILKTKVSQEVDFAQEGHIATIKDLHKVVKEIAIQTATLWPSLPGASSRKQGERSTATNSSAGMKRKAEQETPRDQVKRSKDNGGSPSTPTLPKCLNTKCDGFHLMKDCPNTPKALSRKLLKEYHNKKKGMSGGSSDSAGPSANNGTRLRQGQSRLAPGYENDMRAFTAKWAVDILPPALGEEEIKEYRTFCLPDTGADYSLIDYALLSDLEKETGVKIKLYSLPSAIQYRTVLLDKFTVTEFCHLTIRLKTNAGLTIFKDIVFHVSSLDIDAHGIILGANFLKESLGLDMSDFLANCTPIENPNVTYDNDDDSVSDSESKDTVRSDEVNAQISAYTYAPISYGDSLYDPIDLESAIGANFGVDTPEDIQQALYSMISRAREQGLTDRGCSYLRKILLKHKKAFVIQMGDSNPARVEPLQLKQKPNAQPIRLPTRKYGITQTAFINATVKELKAVGFIKPCPQARWAAVAHPAPKSSAPEGFRLTFDYSGTNDKFYPIANSVPNMEQITHQVVGSKVYADIDFRHAFWQIPLHENSQEFLAFTTPNGTFAPTRVPQGYQDSSSYFQAITYPLFEKIRSQILQYLDDFLIHAKDENQLLKVIEKFLSVCSDYNLKIGAEKTNLFLKEAKFCGRIVSPEGVRYDPRNMDTLKNMQQPQYANELVQFLNAANWMRSSIPQFAHVASPLRAALRQATAKAGKSTKRALARIKLDTIWNTECTKAFDTIKLALQKTVNLAHFNEDKATCLFTDASDKFWSAIVTQVPTTDLHKPYSEQDHVPLAFLSGEFDCRQRAWSTIEKEAYPIIHAFDRLYYLLDGNHVFIFTDHKNLQSVYSPSASMSRVKVGKLNRWATILSQKRYTIVHIAGEENVWADLLTRWAVLPTVPPPTVQARSTTVRTSDSSLQIATFKLCALKLEAPIIPETNSWPPATDIAKSQEARANKPPGLKLEDKLYRFSNKKIWIPEDDRLLHLRILIAAHTGPAGHRGIESTLLALESYYWETMYEDTKDFINSCLHCLLADSSVRIPRPLGSALHATKPNEVLHFDYLYIGKGREGFTYILIIKDDLSSFLRLVPTKLANAITTADILISWFADFGIALTWVSDQGTHFKNEVIHYLAQEMHTHHHFTLPYTPWSNGTVEVVCREVLRCLRALLSEWTLPFQAWPSVVPVVQSALNNAKLKRLNNLAPITVFTKLPSASALNTITTAKAKATSTHTIDNIRLQQLLQVQQTLEKVDEMHHNVKALTSRRRDAAIARHNKKTSVRQIEFTTGDFVLCRQLHREHGRKAQCRWNGPYRVIECLSDWLFIIENLLTKEKQTVHGTRLKLFRNADFEVTEHVNEHLRFQEGELFIVESLDTVRSSNGKVEIFVNWKGLEEGTWEPYENMQTDVPEIVSQFLDKIRNSGTPAEKRIAHTL